MEIEVRDSFEYSGRVWHKKGEDRYYHREDGPAIIYNSYLNKEYREFWYYYDIKYNSPEDMPLNLFLAYVKWEYKKNGNSN